MTTISSQMTSATRESPLTRLQKEVRSEASAGTLSSTDASALNSALTSIDQSLKSGSTTSSSKPSGEDMKARIDGLIADQVKAGTLTSDQADALKKVFEAAKPSGGAKGAGGPPPAGGAGGPPPAGGDGDGDADDTGTASTTSSSSSSSDAATLLKEFLENLKSTSSSSSYGATGSSTLATSSALVLDTVA